MLNWRFRPNSRFYSNDVTYHINERGFRDYVYAYEKQKDTYRVFLASDSVGFGTNVHLHESYPKILERELKSYLPHSRPEVVNYSMPGLSIKQKLRLVQAYALRYAPDLILIDFVLNDAEFESRKDVERERGEECSFALIRMPMPCGVKAQLKRSAFLFLAKEAVERVLRTLKVEDKNQYYEQVENDYYHRLYAREETAQYLYEVFRDIHDYQTRNKIPIAMPIFPLIYEYGKYKWTDLNDRIMSLCAQNEITPICCSKIFESTPTMRCEYSGGILLIRR